MHRPRAAVDQADGTSRLHRFFADLGPGLITGAADDDPSGITTYSVAGATFGYSVLWAAVLSLPLITAVQLMCARLGLVTGRGLAGIIRRRYSRWVLWGSCALLVTANVVNIAADLGGMGEATSMVTGLPAAIWVPAYALFVVSLLFWSSYRTIARVLKWLTIVLLAYVLTAFYVHVDWRTAVHETLIPDVDWSPRFLAVLVGIFGTTISPYLFFWQSAQEVEEERAMGRSLAKRRGATAAELRACRRDVVIGMFAANTVMYFIILTTGATLHAKGQMDIQTAQQAAEALRPLAGNQAYWLFTLGLVGTGMLAVPILAGSCAYAVAEAAAWRGSLDRRPHQAKRFYAVLVAAMALGLAVDFAGVSAMTLLFAAAVINGLLAPPLILIVVLLTSDRSVMGQAVNSRLLDALGWITWLVMTAAACGLLFTSGKN